MYRVFILILALAIAAPFLPVPAKAEPAAVNLMNQFRSKHRRDTLDFSRALELAAIRHAEDMAKHGFLGHRGSNGSTVADRVRAQGYHFCYLAENVARGQRSLEGVMRAWEKSKSHRKNMESRKVTEFAVARGPNNFWVMVLADPGC